MKTDWIRRDIEAECRKFRQELTFYENTDTFVTRIEHKCRMYRQLHPTSTTTYNDSERKEVKE